MAKVAFCQNNRELRTGRAERRNVCFVRFPLSENYFSVIRKVGRKKYISAVYDVMFRSGRFNVGFRRKRTTRSLAIFVIAVARLDLHETAAKQHAINAVNKIKIVMIFFILPSFLILTDIRRVCRSVRLSRRV